MQEKNSYLESDPIVDCNKEIYYDFKNLKL